MTVAVVTTVAEPAGPCTGASCFATGRDLTLSTYDVSEIICLWGSGSSSDTSIAGDAHGGGLIPSSLSQRTGAWTGADPLKRRSKPGVTNSGGQVPSGTGNAVPSVEHEVLPEGGPQFGVNDGDSRI